MKIVIVKLFYDYTAKNAQVVTSLLTPCKNLLHQVRAKTMNSRNEAVFRFI